MSEVSAPVVRAPKEPRNGVDTPALLATINAVKETPGLATFRFRGSNRCVNGTYSDSRVESFTGAGGGHAHESQFTFGADHPAVLVGRDLGMSDKVRNGYERIRITFDIAGDAPPEKLRQIVQQSRARSAVFDVLMNGVPVDVSINTR